MARFLRRLYPVVLIASLVPAASGQTLIPSTNVVYTPQWPTPGAGHDYIHMLDETVNPADGNVSVEISLPVPPGRGLTIPFSIVYSSSNFGVMQRTQPNPWNPSSNFGGGNYSFLTSSGWSYTFPTLSYVMAYQQSGQVTTDKGDVPGYCPYASNYIFQAPGSARRHQMLLSNVYTGLSLPAPGTTGTSIPGDYCFGGGSGSAFLWGGDEEFQAALPSNLDPRVTPSVAVADADGTIYTFAGSNSSNPSQWFFNGAPNSEVTFPTSIEDRNGNQMTLSNTYGNGTTCSLAGC